MSRTLMISSCTLLLVASCASTPATSTADVRVTAWHHSDSWFAESVRKETVGALRHYSPLVQGLTLTAVVDGVADDPLATTFVNSSNPGHAVPFVGGDAVTQGARPMVGVSGGSSATEGFFDQTAEVRGTYQITDAAGRTLESGPLSRAAVASGVNTPLGARMRLTSVMAEFLASRLAALSQRGR